jgi:hypothetical protein
MQSYDMPRRGAMELSGEVVAVEAARRGPV